MDKRLNITISFSHDSTGYEYVKNQPNSSHYIRKLVKDDMDKLKNKNKKEDVNNNFDVIDVLDW